jgi:hypothetical protein
MALTLHGKQVKVRYIAVFNEKQEIIGDALELNPPAIIEMQIVGERVGFQLWMPTEDGVGIHISNPHIVGIALLDSRKQFLAGLSIPGNPELREENELFVLKSRYIILEPKKEIPCA